MSINVHDSLDNQLHAHQVILPWLTFANSLDPDQARQNVGPDLGPNCWYSHRMHEIMF